MHLSRSLGEQYSNGVLIVIRTYVPNHNRWENIIHKPRLSQLQESGDPVHCYVCKAISHGMIHDVVCIVVCGQSGCVLLLGSGARLDGAATRVWKADGS